LLLTLELYAYRWFTRGIYVAERNLQCGCHGEAEHEVRHNMG